MSICQTPTANFKNGFKFIHLYFVKLSAIALFKYVFTG